MPRVSSRSGDHGLALLTLTEDKEDIQNKSQATDLVDEVHRAEAKGLLRSKWRHTLGKDMLAFFTLVLSFVRRNVKCFSAITNHLIRLRYLPWL